MGAYAAAGFLAVVALAIVLWVGGPEAPRCEVELAADAPWTSAVLDDGRSQRALNRGERIDAPPGTYRLTLHDADGRSELRALELSGALTTLR
ncbi:MAG: hypothetical protein ACYTG2_08770 [Planctomycetota bacterium]